MVVAFLLGPPCI